MLSSNHSNYNEYRHRECFASCHASFLVNNWAPWIGHPSSNFQSVSNDSSSCLRNTNVFFFHPLTLLCVARLRCVCLSINREMTKKKMNHVCEWVYTLSFPSDAHILKLHPSVLFLAVHRRTIRVNERFRFSFWMNKVCRLLLHLLFFDRR